MASTSAAAEASTAGAGEESQATQTMNNDEKEKPGRILGGETRDIFGKYLLY